MEEFNKWNEIKKKISDSVIKIDRFPKEGEVWMSCYGKNIGFVNKTEVEKIFLDQF